MASSEDIADIPVVTQGAPSSSCLQYPVYIKHVGNARSPAIVSRIHADRHIVARDISRHWVDDLNDWCDRVLGGGRGSICNIYCHRVGCINIARGIISVSNEVCDPVRGTRRVPGEGERSSTVDGHGIVIYPELHPAHAN